MRTHKGLSEPRDGLVQSGMENEGREGERCQVKFVVKEIQGSTVRKKGGITSPALSPAGHEREPVLED